MPKVKMLDQADVTAEQLVTELTLVSRKGLPASQKAAGEVLPNLKSVFARSIHPDQLISRLDALNNLIPALFGKLGDENYQEAARMLFGLALGTRGSLLSERRRQAAALLGYNVDHFRTRVEPEIIAAVAKEMIRDLLRYKSRVKRAAESMEPTGDTPTLTAEDLTAEEELVSRIWQHVYGLRAELIAHLRLKGQEGYEGQAEDHRQAAVREESQLKELIQDYAGTYGKQLIRHQQVEFAVEGLERVARWRM